ncbi:MAG TPA: hypothetical protein VJJ23_04630 [Candidatus Nanoarchaeia archaeon]|nr:hypothetical protein [Candidatus Nanoarchaeia archaeon]
MVNTYTKQLEELFPFYLNVNGTKTFLKTIQPKYWKLFFDTLKNGPEINSNHDELSNRLIGTLNYPANIATESENKELSEIEKEVKRIPEGSFLSINRALIAELKVRKKDLNYLSHPLDDSEIYSLTSTRIEAEFRRRKEIYLMFFLLGLNTAVFAQVIGGRNGGFLGNLLTTNISLAIINGTKNLYNEPVSAYKHLVRRAERLDDIR